MASADASFGQTGDDARRRTFDASGRIFGGRSESSAVVDVVDGLEGAAGPCVSALSGRAGRIQSVDFIRFGRNALVDHFAVDEDERHSVRADLVEHFRRDVTSLDAFVAAAVGHSGRRGG